MNDTAQMLLDTAVLVIILTGIWRFRRTETALGGNLMVVVALLCALGASLLSNPVRAPVIALVAFTLGSLGGGVFAARVTMTQIPALVGLQNGAGGLASCLVAFVSLTTWPLHSTGGATLAAVFGLAVGAATFSGSAVASGKLSGLLRQSPVVMRGHNAWLLAGIVMIGMLAAGLGMSSEMARYGFAAAMAIASACVGVLVSMRVGGADMPVLISLLNALSGLSAGLIGVAVQSRVLTACGATVAASGLILTYAMCQAMNRSLLGALSGATLDYARRQAGRREAEVESEPVRNGFGTSQEDLVPQALEWIKAARKLIFVPGYGMALAQAQSATVQLANRCREMGKDVRFAIHPLAGRMPGHMHVLLAEAEIDPDMLFDLDEVNDQFATADLAVVVGACDVVNPAAVSVAGTPISGMPILAAQEARRVLVCNLDARPGYSGVENPLYTRPQTLLLLGDAAQSVSRLLESLR
jgi:NAD/NADP transhydrogenase beta subunit